MNDGGLSWLRKNYQRMKEQAEREQRSLDDVVAERYGVSPDAGSVFRFTGTIVPMTKCHRIPGGVVWYSVNAKLRLDINH